MQDQRPKRITTPQEAIDYLRDGCNRSAAGTCYGTCHARGTDAMASCALIEIAEVIATLAKERDMYHGR